MGKVVETDETLNKTTVLKVLKSTGNWDSDEALKYVRAHLPFLRDIVHLGGLAVTSCGDATEFPLAPWRYEQRRYRLPDNLVGKYITVLPSQGFHYLLWHDFHIISHSSSMDFRKM